MLDSCDRATPTGRRDYAIVLLLARLGLRRCEVAAISLDDVDWRAGEIVIHGKGSRIDRLPLPCDIGEAIVDYLRDGRPRVLDRALFITVCAPLTGISRGCVTDVVRYACMRAGIAPVGAHRLRHTAATELLRRGAGLAEIGQVLRHQNQPRPRSMPRSIARRCRRWRCRGRGASDDPASAQAVDDYLAMRRALGFKLTEHGRVLPQFAAFLAQRDESLITTALGARVRDPASAGERRVVASAVGDRARLRALPAGVRHAP